MTLALRQVSLRLGERVLLAPFSLDVAAGDIVTLMGPSGSGKSSLLSFIGGDLAGAVTATGEVLVEGVAVTSLAPERRHIGRLFQDDFLFPHMTVAENLLFGMGGEDRGARMALALVEAGLEGFAARAPHTLSGGERSRVALLRSLLAEPKVMLLDEPFAKLDAELRQAMRGLVFRSLATRKIATLLVSHDPSDAPAGGRLLRISPTGELRDD
ncbi:MAG: ATP-binding cassette domain-containing protein [Alphaproteobacteria bacterium]|nr:ATP-binding cassette domain-containing protein [Alphaproteobacteria bacterium]